jgi:hypothetical protein
MLLAFGGLARLELEAAASRPPALRPLVDQPTTDNARRGNTMHHKKHKPTKTKLRVHWTTVESSGSLAPAGREGHSANVINNLVYTFGGLENGARVSKLLSFDLTNHRWSTQADRLETFNTHNTTANTTTTLGASSFNNAVDVGETEALEPATTEPPLPRCYHDSWVVGHRMLSFGGEGSTSNADKETRDGFKNSNVFDDPATHRRTRRVCFDDVSLYNTLDHTWEVVKSGLAPLPRKGHTCTMVGEGTEASIVVFGGEPSGKGTPMNDTHCVSVGSLLEGVAMWEKQRPLGDTPSPRHGHTAVALVDSSTKTNPDQSYLVMFGGTGGGGLLFNDVCTFGLVTKEWENLTCDGLCPTARYGHTACMVPKRTAITPTHATATASTLSTSATFATPPTPTPQKYYRGAHHPIMVIFGGVTRNGSELNFCRDMQVLHMKTKTWSEVRTTHLYPSPRYGHAMVLLPTPFESKAPLEGGRKTEEDSPYTSSNHVHVCKMLIFGGLNARYCSNEIWSAELQMMKTGRETWGDGFDDAGDGGGMHSSSSSSSSPQQKRNRKSVSGDEFEQVNRELMKERKLKILAEERLIAERKVKQLGLEEIARLKRTVSQARERMVQTTREADAKVARVKESGEEDRRQLDVLRNELDESRRLLSLMDLSGQVRVRAWQQRAEDAEEKLARYE